MPIRCEPGGAFEVVLPGDQEKPPEVRPTFVARVLSVREAMNLMHMAEVIDKAKTDQDMPFDTVEDLMGILEANLTGWRNMTEPGGEPIAFGPGALAEVLTMQEAFEMMTLLTAQGMGAAERKKSESPSDSSTDASAASAPPPVE